MNGIVLGFEIAVGIAIFWVALPVAWVLLCGTLWACKAIFITTFLFARWLVWDFWKPRQRHLD